MFFLFFPLLLFSLEINISYFNNNPPQEILTLKNNFPFMCYKKKDIICEFNKIPSTTVFKTSTKFFKIVPIFKNNKFYLLIKTDKKIKIIKRRDDYYKNPLLTNNEKKAKKWIIVVNDSFLTNKKASGLNFYFKRDIKVYIPAVDENQNPIDINNQAQDVLIYFNILKEFKKGVDVSIDIDNFLNRFKTSVFVPDVLYMKMVILDRKNDFNDLIEIGKKWIKKYAYEDKLKKVLLLMAKAYSKIGLYSEASYFFNRIITEYPDSNEAELAKIYLADQLFTLGDDKKAFRLYKEVLFSTKDLNIASLAATRLAKRYINKGEVKKALSYYEKVYKANREFLLKDKNKAFELVKTLAENKLYPLAIKIGEDLLKRLKPLNDMYEPLLYYLALWNYENKNYEKSLYYINLYLDKFPYGFYSDKVSELKDKVIFNVPDKNLTRQLQYIDKIISEYNQSDIAQKALVKKVEILYKLKKYDEILKLEEKLPKNLFKDKEKFLQKVQKEYVIFLLDKNKCIKAINLIEKYHIVLDKKYDEKIYKCAMKTFDYKLASRICNKYLNSPDDKIFIKWMKRKIEALKGMKDYKNLVLAIDDLCQLKKNCYKYKLYKFFALWNLGEYKKALNIANSITKIDIKNSDVYIKIVKWALKNRDYLLAATFAKKIIDLQNRFKVYPYSPFVEFVYVKYSKNKNESIKILKELLKRVSGENRARSLFLLANLTKNKEYLKECLKVKNSTLWKNLCKDALNLF